MNASHTPESAVGSTAAAQRPPAVSYKPPQPGVKPRIIGSNDGAFAALRVIGRDAEFSGAVMPMAWMGNGGARAKLTVALATPQAPAPGLQLHIPDLDATQPHGQKFWHPAVPGPVFVADGRLGPYLTTDAQDQAVRPGMRAAIISLPGQLEFAAPHDRDRPSMLVLAQGHEALRNQPGAFLSKAIVAYPVDAGGMPTHAGLEALRTFWTKPTKPEHVPLPYLTPKYDVVIDKAGHQQVLQWDGLASVKAGRTNP